MPLTYRLKRSGLAFLAISLFTTFGFGQPANAAPPQPVANTAISSTCRLSSAQGQIQRVVYIQFDNTHFRRDLPNVPSDLELMPNLLRFITGQGTLLDNDHTILISHTAGGILSSLTGVYPDRHGQIVSNSYVRYNGAGFLFPSSFGYWTDPSTAAAGSPFNMVTPDGTNAPAPWVPFTRAGCDFGAIATANTVLENTGTGPSGDITKVFGNPSPQFTAASTSNAAPFGTAARAKAQTDFVGLAIHCGQVSSVCAAGHPDLLPQEPGGYAGFKGLVGAQEIHSLLTGQPAGSPPATVPMNDLLGNPIADPFGQPGFPGFDGMSAAVSLAYTAAMLEKGIPITYAYISDAHDNHGVSGNVHVAYGPGQEGYVKQLKAYDDAFGVFFQRLRTAGITKDNTLFVFTVDEGDHFVGSKPSPAGCDGVRVFCTYDPIGEITVNIKTLMSAQHPEITTNFTVHGDMAPAFYLSGNPNQTSLPTRAFEQAAGNLTAVNPYTGATDRLSKKMVDQVGMKLLHMFTTGDLLRNPTFTMFANPSYFVTDFPTSTCTTCINPLFAWNHGGIEPEIATTWLGMVGPGVRNLRISDVWADHTDVRPTMLALLGLTDSYAHDGRVVSEVLHPPAIAQSLTAHHETLLRLGQTYKQLNAPFGQLGMDSLDIASVAVSSASPGDSRYTELEGRLNGFLVRRNALAQQMSEMLQAAAFRGQAINEQRAKQLIDQGRDLIEDVGEVRAGLN